ncbi:MAG TPA: 1,2-phenylacetyl-CoA epoxidase subunit PaaC [Acidimicrobiia bacterium]
MIGSETATADSGSVVTALVAHGDDNLVLAQRLGEWISNAPELEEDIALGNIALDHLGVARALYTHAGEIEGRGRTEDDFAMRRAEREFLNVLLVEQPNGDFAHTMVRALFFDAYQVDLWEGMTASDDETLSGIAARAGKEARYHLLHSSAWVVRLGDGTEESHRRAQNAVDALWRFTGELFQGPGQVSPQRWRAAIEEVLDEAGLGIPDDPHQRGGGRRGLHSEHLGPLLAEMQWMQRSYPGLQW